MQQKILLYLVQRASKSPEENPSPDLSMTSIPAKVAAANTASTWPPANIIVVGDRQNNKTVL